MHLVMPFNRDTARQFALGKTIRRKGTEHVIEVFGITDAGVYLGYLEGGPFITYEWAAENVTFLDGSPFGVVSK